MIPIIGISDPLQRNAQNLVDKWLARSDLPEYFTLEDVAQGAGLVDHPGRVSKELAARLRNILKLRGCQPVRKRLNGAKNPTRCFYPPGGGAFGAMTQAELLVQAQSLQVANPPPAAPSGVHGGTVCWLAWTLTK